VRYININIYIFIYIYIYINIYIYIYIDNHIVDIVPTCKCLISNGIFSACE